MATTVDWRKAGMAGSLGALLSSCHQATVRPTVAPGNVRMPVSSNNSSDGVGTPGSAIQQLLLLDRRPAFKICKTAPRQRQRQSVPSALQQTLEMLAFFLHVLLNCRQTSGEYPP